MFWFCDKIDFSIERGICFMADKIITMAQLLAKKNFQVVNPKKDDVIKGIITAKNNKSLILDIKAKTEGVVAGSEYEIAKEYIKDFKVGDEIDVVVISPETSKGQIILSLKQTASKMKWDVFNKSLDSNEIIEAKGLEINKGGLIVLYSGVRGFIPSSQFGKAYLGNLNQLKGKKIKVKIIEVDKEKNRLIFSEKLVSEAKELALKDQAIKSVKVEEEYNGVISGVMSFGLFITVEVAIKGKKSLGLIDGLVHISEISWEKVNHPKDFYKIGERVKVKVMSVDENGQKLNLSIKQLTSDPWNDIELKYPAGTTISGTISRVEPFGIFVNLEPGIDGLIHYTRIKNETKKFNKSEKISVTVETIDKENRRMSLSPIDNEVPIYK